MTCVVSHRLGHSEENTLTAGRDESGNKNNIQAVGSTITYLQRYTLKAALASPHPTMTTVRMQKPAFISADELKRIIALADDVGSR